MVPRSLAQASTRDYGTVDSTRRRPRGGGESASAWSGHGGGRRCRRSRRRRPDGHGCMSCCTFRTSPPRRSRAAVRGLDRPLGRRTRDHFSPRHDEETRRRHRGTQVACLAGTRENQSASCELSDRSTSASPHSPIKSTTGDSGTRFRPEVGVPPPVCSQAGWRRLVGPRLSRSLRFGRVVKGITSDSEDGSRVHDCQEGLYGREDRDWKVFAMQVVVRT